DPRGAIPPYDAVIMLSPRRADDARFKAVLAPLLNTIPVQTMRGANYSVDRPADKVSPADAAAALARTIGRQSAMRTTARRRSDAGTEAHSVAEWALASH
ncbi:MAG: hypothetical protein JO303_00560, partial [Caulobacteraceae bacterium]|nr:hypothetical protein [Caulobacteraceae bacterium]